MSDYEDFSVLFIDKDLKPDSLRSDVVKGLINELEKIGCSTFQVTTAKDGKLLALRPEVCCILVSWETINDMEAKMLVPILNEIKERNPYLSIFLYTDKENITDIPPEAFSHIDGYFYMYEDTYGFVARRIKEALDKYITDILPPFFKVLKKYSQESKYSWHTPGHSGGVALLKSPVGRAFFNFYGENSFRSDLSVSVPELGSLSEHTDVVGDAEKEAAKSFGSDATYFVLNGTSTANKMVWHSAVTAGDHVLVDRNCHKSLMHAIVMIGAIPHYLKPTRNKYGILGPVPLKEIRDQIDSLPNKNARISVITNSTYDGICYKAPKIIKAYKDNVEVAHFDEAWFAYANFHPFYKNCYGMSVKQNELTIFTTHSTHKLLAAFSQASMLHVNVKEGEKWEDHHDRFNEAFMMHTSTSPQYSIIASLDVAARMMKGTSGKALLQDIIEEAFNFRYLFNKIKEQKKEKWPFTLWQPDFDSIKDTDDKPDFKNWTFNLTDWEPVSKLWTLNPDDKWHGFKGIDEDYVLLDPIKVTILTPGIEDGDKYGIPASIVSKYLRAKGAVAEKTGMYSFLILFSPGITKGKAGTMLSILRQFTEDYIADTPLRIVFPDMKFEKEKKYNGNTGLRSLCNLVHKKYMKKITISDTESLNAIELANSLSDHLPEPGLIPAEAYSELIRNNIELVHIEKLEGRTSSVLVAPYPPGIPVVMPGEIFNKRLVEYFKFCKEFDTKFPDFETEIHGMVINKDNEYLIYCVK